MLRLVFLFSILLLMSVPGCRFSTTPAANTSNNSSSQPIRPTPSATEQATPEETGSKSATLICQTVNAGDYEVYKKQTFAIDFEPFRNSCFVTSNNPEFNDPPMESAYAIYKGGKKVFDFPSQFNGVTFGCWVDAVSFQDLNGDKLTDIIVVSKCQAKSGDYNENMVYANTGKAFTTREDANTQIGEFRSVKQVADFVRENRSMFF